MRCTSWVFSAPQKMTRDPSVGTGAAAAVTVGTGRMVPSVGTVSQVSEPRVPASFPRAEGTGCLLPGLGA